LVLNLFIDFLLTDNMETDYRKALDPHVGKNITVYPQGLDPLEGKLEEGPVSYLVRGEKGMLLLFPGHPARIEVDGETIELSKLHGRY
jgi:hypothetical protein